MTMYRKDFATNQQGMILRNEICQVHQCGSRTRWTGKRQDLRSVILHVLVDGIQSRNYYKSLRQRVYQFKVFKQKKEIRQQQTKKNIHNSYPINLLVHCDVRNLIHLKRKMCYFNDTCKRWKVLFYKSALACCCPNSHPAYDKPLSNTVQR